MKSTVSQRINFHIETFSCGWYVNLVNQMLITRRSILLEHSEMFSTFIMVKVVAKIIHHPWSSHH